MVLWIRTRVQSDFLIVCSNSDVGALRGKAITCSSDGYWVCINQASLQYLSKTKIAQIKPSRGPLSWKLEKSINQSSFSLIFTALYERESLSTNDDANMWHND